MLVLSVHKKSAWNAPRRDIIAEKIKKPSVNTGYWTCFLKNRQYRYLLRQNLLLSAFRKELKKLAGKQLHSHLFMPSLLAAREQQLPPVPQLGLQIQPEEPPGPRLEALLCQQEEHPGFEAGFGAVEVHPERGPGIYGSAQLLLR